MKKTLILALALAVLLTMSFIALSASAASAEGAAAVEDNFPTLEQGSQGREVRVLQKQLNALGFSVSYVDGVFGPKTERALKGLQSYLGWEPTGVVDSADQFNAIVAWGTQSEPNLLDRYALTMTTSAYCDAKNAYEGCVTLHCDNREAATDTYIDMGAWSGLEIEPNADYTLSFVAKGKGVIDSYLYPNAVARGVSNQRQMTEASDGHVSFELSDSWTRYSLVWHTREDIAEAKGMIAARVYGGNEAFISQIKLEKGAMPTQFVEPSMEDSFVARDAEAAENLLADYSQAVAESGYADGVDTYEGSAALHFDAAALEADAYQDVGIWKGLTLEPNTQYTLSFWAKGSGQIHSYLFPNAVANGVSLDGAATVASDGHIATDLTDEWKQVVIVWRTMPEISDAKNMIAARVMSGDEVFVSRIKLEKGSYATPWAE